MRKFFKDCKGAVTVMVTLLLIPSILISGTGVDLARIYAARSTLQDANQLAANSVLASYDALLQDLYGIFGIMQEDPELTEITNDYIKMAVMGSGQEDKLGTFRLFYGSNLEPGGIVAARNQNLGNSAVLRRQIEEYSKFRAPVVVAERLMDKLEIFEKVQEDAKVIQKKMEVDDGVEELEKYYKKIYDRVQTLKECKPTEEEAMQKVRDSGQVIQGGLEVMAGIREEYAKTKLELEDAKTDLEEAQQDLSELEAQLVSLDPEDEDYEETVAELQESMEELTTKIEELTEKIEELTEKLEELEVSYTATCTAIELESSLLKGICDDYEEKLSKYLTELNKLRDECETAEKKKKELKDKIEELKKTLNGNCSDELKKGLQEPEEGAADGKSILERYEDLLVYDIESMGKDMHTADYEQVYETIHTNMKKASLGGYELLDFRTMDVEGTFPITGEPSELLPFITASTDYRPHPGRDGTGFLEFFQIKDESRRFYEELEKIYNSERGAGANKKKLMKAVTKIFSKAQDLFGGLIFIPEGAKYLTGGENTSDPSTGTNFGTDGDWSRENEGKNKLKGALDDDFLGSLSRVAGEAGNKILLLVYGTEMFSDASTPGSKKTESEDESKRYPQKNMAGIPLTTDVNYYFQSELEYLYNGNLADAQSNLRSVAGMIFLVRFVFNYVASFSIRGVNQIVNMIRNALAYTGPFAVLAGELARLALAIGESAMDVSRLRSGDAVAIYKKNTTWKLSISGLANAATDEISDSTLDAAFDTEDKDGDDEGATLSYTDYIRLFLLLVPGDDLAERIGNLIELNVTNKKLKINADEESMASAERVDLSKAITDFSITTTVDLRMLFLSMPFAQKGIDGVIPPKTFPITVTDYRGY